MSVSIIDFRYIHEAKIEALEQKMSQLVMKNHKLRHLFREAKVMTLKAAEIIKGEKNKMNDLDLSLSERGRKFRPELETIVSEVKSMVSQYQTTKRKLARSVPRPEMREIGDIFG